MVRLGGGAISYFEECCLSQCRLLVIFGLFYYGKMLSVIVRYVVTRGMSVVPGVWSGDVVCH